MSPRDRTSENGFVDTYHMYFNSSFQENSTLGPWGSPDLTQTPLHTVLLSFELLKHYFNFIPPKLQTSQVTVINLSFPLVKHSMFLLECRFPSCNKLETWLSWHTVLLPVDLDLLNLGSLPHTKHSGTLFGIKMNNREVSSSNTIQDYF